MNILFLNFQIHRHYQSDFIAASRIQAYTPAHEVYITNVSTQGTTEVDEASHDTVPSRMAITVVKTPLEFTALAPS